MSRQILSQLKGKVKENRIDQMTKQENLIAKKRQEIIEKQKNAEKLAELAKIMTSKSNQETSEEIDQVPVTTNNNINTSTSFRNAFNNDGSFLEKFKKVTETTKVEELENKTDDSKLDELILNEDSNSAKKDESSEETFKNQIEYLDSDTNISNPCSTKMSSISFGQSVLLPQSIVNTSLPPPSVPIISQLATPLTPIFFNPTIPPPLTHLNPNSCDQNLYATTEIQGMQIPPPPPPPKSLVNEISIKNHEHHHLDFATSELQAITSTTSDKVFSDNDKLPTTFEQLIDMVAEKGDDFEDKLRLHKNDLHSSLWFLFTKDTDEYRNYRQQIVNIRRKKRLENTKYDPAEIYIEKDDDLCNDSDSDYEYMKEAKERNLTNMKLRLTNRRDECYSSDSDEDDDDDDVDDDDDDDDEDDDEVIINNDKKKRFDNNKRYHPKDDDFLNKDNSESDSDSKSSKKTIKKSRWGDKVECDTTFELPPFFSTTTTTSNNNNNNINNDQLQQQPQQIQIQPLIIQSQPPPIYKQTRTDLALLQYARINFGTTDLDENKWKMAEEHYKINLLYQDMLKKRQEIDRLAKNGKFKYEYDSDEDISGGTWEHKLRSAEMQATEIWADALNKHSEGKHHIGDFLPPEELKKFMEQYNAKKNNREPDLSDYKEYKLKEDNIGFQMLKKLGWKEGLGLGASGSGIIDPINKAAQRESNQGLGASSVGEPEDNDNEYEKYRKRMMLAYRFRPNPLNNPRRAYY